MKSKIKKSLNTKIWFYMGLFSILILVFLWMFQILFLDTYYEHSKTKDMKKLAKEITVNYKKSDSIEDFLNYLERISFQKGICIDITSNSINTSLSIMNRDCIRGNFLNKYQEDFKESKNAVEKYTFNNPEFNNKTLVYGIKLDEDTNIFISTSLVPIDQTVSILKNQFIYVTIIVLVLGFIISYFISRLLSKPIVKITKESKELAKGNYNTNFKYDSGIKEIDELSDTLDKTSKELKRTDELRRDLMANVSHDLKTPLTMIKAYSEMVRDLTYNDKEKREKNLNTIIEETDRLNNLVNDILDLSVIESKMLILNKEEFNLTEVTKSIINRYDIYTDKEDYKFIFDYDKDLIINADKAKIEQVIYNLINNAINYIGEDKEVVINFIKEKNNVRVEISDHGDGIDSEELNYIWDKYYRSKKNHKRSVAGTGLGLSIVKNILELHEYEYGVNSEKGKGTTFYFIIPTKKR